MMRFEKDPDEIMNRPEGEDLHEHHAPSQILITDIPYSVFRVDRQYRYTAFNPLHAQRMLALYGATIEIGHRFLDYFTVPEDRDIAQCNVDRTLAGEQFVVTAHEAGPLQSRLILNVRHMPIWNDRGEVVEASVFTDDITELKLTQLEESEALYRSLFENIGSVILVIDPDTAGIVDANPLACTFYGYSHAELTRLTILDLAAMPSADVRQRVQKIAAGEVSYMTIPHRLANGEIRDVEVYLSRRVFKGRKENIAVVHDITTRKQAEKALRESEEHFSTIFHATHDAIGISRLSDGVFIDVNDAFCSIFGLSREQIIGRTSHNLKLWKDIYQPNEEKSASGENDHAPEFEAQFRRSTGQTGFMLVSANVAKIGGEDCLLVFGKDISLRKQAEAALQDTNLALQKALRLKDEFMAAMSHELRTPLSSILGLSESMQELTFGFLNEKQLSVVRTIEKSGQRLLGLVNDILDYSNLQSGSVSLAVELCSMEKICRGVLQSNMSLAEKKQQHIGFHMTPEQINIQADGERLSQMLNILVGNAIKFTGDGGEIGIEVFGDHEKKQVLITVWDTGIGIKEEDLPRLFKPFVQLDARLAREYQGTGLGLALVKQLAELSGGGVGVESIWGKGSRFSVTLPWVE